MTIARTLIRNEEECGDCIPGVPDVPPDEVIVTPPPTDDCADGDLDVTVTLDPEHTTPAPPC